MMEIWDRISYTVQLLASCLIFMLPIRKKKYFYILAVAAGAVIVGFSYWLNGLYILPSTKWLLIAYWFQYVIFCIVYVWLCTGMNIVQSVYCALLACGVQHISFDIYIIQQETIGSNALLSVVIYLAVYILFYFFYTRKLPDYGQIIVNKEAVIPIATMILLIWILSVLEYSDLLGMASGGNYSVVYRIMDGLCCYYVLWVQINQKERMSLQRELNEINAIWRQQKKQYEVTKEAIDSINRKCHDLKHQIRMLRNIEDNEEKESYLKALEDDIMIYDTALKTGNKALDTVLMEKGLFCKDHGISWSCMVDGAKLDFMRNEDIYAVFGNSLENAINAVMALDDPQERVISVKIIVQKNIMVIQIQNYYEGTLKFVDGLPLTTKKNRRNHGFGMKSIRYTAEKYNGTVTVQAKDKIFTLQILIPIEVNEK